MNVLTATLAAAFALTMATTAPAATHLLEQQVDAGYIAANGSSNIDWSAPAFDLAVGDTLTAIFTFAPGQRLAITNPTGLWLVLNVNNDGVPHDVTFTESLTFLNLDGPAQNVASRSSSTTGWGLMATFGQGDFLSSSDTSPISFSGLRFDIAVTGYSDSLTQRTYTSTFMVALGDQVSAVPESPSSALFALGVLILFGTKLRSALRSHAR